MANKKSAKKDILVNKRNKERNVHFKSSLKTAIKKAEAAIESYSNETQESTKTAVTFALKKIDKIVSKGILHANTGARAKSKLAKKYNTIAK